MILAGDGRPMALSILGRLFSRMRYLFHERRLTVGAANMFGKGKDTGKCFAGFAVALEAYSIAEHLCLIRSYVRGKGIG